jgi:hypothetical protein
MGILYYIEYPLLIKVSKHNDLQSSVSENKTTMTNKKKERTLVQKVRKKGAFHCAYYIRSYVISSQSTSEIQEQQ